MNGNDGAEPKSSVVSGTPESVEPKASVVSGAPGARWRLSDRKVAVIGLWSGFLGIVIGLLSGYYFYEISVQERIPTVLVDPTRTLIVDSTAPGSSDVSILYRGKPIGATKSVAAAVFTSGMREGNPLCGGCIQENRVFVPTEY